MKDTYITLLWVIGLLSPLLISCQNQSYVEVRRSCLNHYDCEVFYKNAPLSCLPVLRGETLMEYCEQTECPTDDDFERIAHTLRMPMICDFDDGSDGIADTWMIDQIRPAHWTLIGDVYEAQGEDISKSPLVFYIDSFFASPQKNEGCPQGLSLNAEYQERCLTPPLSTD